MIDSDADANIAPTAEQSKPGASHSETLHSEEVAEFLKEHPDFFVDRDDLLLTMKLPHRRGVAISLVEHQISLLREKHQESRYHLDQLIAAARDNEQTFQRMQKLVLALLESKDLDQVTEVIRDSLAHDFGIDFHALILFSDKPMSLPVRTEHIDVATAALGNLISKGQVVSGRFSEDQVQFLFSEQAEQVGSMTIIPLAYSLNQPPQLGVLALASKDPKHFRAELGSAFTGYLGDVLSRVLAQHMS